MPDLSAEASEYAREQMRSNDAETLALYLASAEMDFHGLEIAKNVFNKMVRENTVKMISNDGAPPRSKMAADALAEARCAEMAAVTYQSMMLLREVLAETEEGAQALVKYDAETAFDSGAEGDQ